MKLGLCAGLRMLIGTRCQTSQQLNDNSNIPICKAIEKSGVNLTSEPGNGQNKWLITILGKSSAWWGALPKGWLPGTVGI